MSAQAAPGSSGNIKQQFNPGDGYVTHKQALGAMGAVIVIAGAFGAFLLSEAKAEGKAGAVEIAGPALLAAAEAKIHASAAVSEASMASHAARESQAQSIEVQKDIRDLSYQIRTGRVTPRLQAEPDPVALPEPKLVQHQP